MSIQFIECFDDHLKSFPVNYRHHVIEFINDCFKTHPICSFNHALFSFLEKMLEINRFNNH